jgi:hypothetical protein
MRTPQSLHKKTREPNTNYADQVRCFGILSRMERSLGRLLNIPKTLGEHMPRNTLGREH